MCICNDRRWPETYRVMGLQNVEMVMLGYNTPLHNAPSPDHDEHSHFHNQLVDAGRRLPERHLGGWRRQGRDRGGRALARRLDYRGAVGQGGGARRRHDDELVVLAAISIPAELQDDDLQLRVHRQPDALSA